MITVNIKMLESIKISKIFKMFCLYTFLIARKRRISMTIVIAVNKS